jgi:acyl carrier protein
VLSPPRVNKLREKYPHLRVVNGYGPTENTTFSACFLIDKDYDIAIPIGTPISNSRAYILNRHHGLQPPGAVGQLYLAGDGLARGYLNNVEFTAERFIRHPFIHGERIYMTGDLARWLPGGVIEFAGRVDHQVKIRGYRVEPGEIESRLLQIDYIKEAVVMVLENQSEADKSLCAYIVSDGKPGVSMLKNTLSAQLPAYMIPSYFVQLEKIPLTANGKVHRKALPLPGFEAGHNYVAPGSEMQKKLIVLWSEVLKVDKNVIGIDDDFFDLGGHSLKAANLAARIHKALNVKIDLAEIFEKPTVRELSRLIAESEAVEHVSIKPVEKLEYYAISSAQKRLYLVQQLTPDSTPYNMYQVIPLKGDIDRQEIEDTFRKLINRHESLRTSFLMAGMETVQVVSAPGDAAFALEYYSISGVPGAGNRYAAAGDFIRPFDLSRAPLLRARLIETGEREFLLMVDMHHIISDGISLNIIRGDFIALLAGQELSPLPLRYRDYVHWQQSRSQEESRAQQEEYWKKEFDDTLPVLNLPTDYKRPVIQSFEGSKLRFALQGKELEIVDKAAESQQATRYRCGHTHCRPGARRPGKCGGYVCQYAGASQSTGRT